MPGHIHSVDSRQVRLPDHCFIDSTGCLCYYSVCFSATVETAIVKHAEGEESMNMDALKSALLKGIPSGIVSWLIYAGVFGVLIDKEPAKTAFFERSTILFFVIITVVEVILYYLKEKKK